MCKVVKMPIGTRVVNVADIKQMYISNIVDAARKCDIIDRVLLFGSSKEKRCKESSDIDIAVFGNQTPSKALSSKKYERFARQLYTFDDNKQAYDILYFKSGTKNNAGIMEDIENGELLYERGE
jgi:predicted nucleotidyltransferase